MTEEGTLYRTRVSILWHIVAAVLLIFFAVMTYFCFFYEIPEDADGSILPWMWIGVSAFCLGIILLMLYTYFRVKYVIRENGLHVTGLFVNVLIPYSSVTEMMEVRDYFAFWYWSNTFMSMDQLRICYSSSSRGTSGSLRRWADSVLVSPKDKEEFIRELEARLKGIRVMRR